jgi:hypothetical protein
VIDRSVANRFVALTPFQEPITYQSRTVTAGQATDDYSQYRLPRARLREITKQDLALLPELLSITDVVVELWQPVLDAVNMPTPKKDDWLTDSKCREWRVALVRGEVGQTVWTLYCQKRV